MLTCRIASTQLRMAGSEAGCAPGCSLFLFCCRTLAVAERLAERVVPDGPCFCFAAIFRWASKERCQGLLECRGAAAKEEGGASGRGPDFRWYQERIQEAKPSTTTGPKPRNQCGKRRFKRSLKCRRPTPFLLHHQKAHLLFGATNRGPPPQPGVAVAVGKRRGNGAV